MTIAIGMLCEGGVIIAADTKVSNPSIGASTDAVKVQTGSSEFGRYVAAYSSERAATGESLLQIVLSDLKLKNPKSLGALKPAVQTTMTKWAKAYTIKDDRPETQLVLAAFMERNENNQHDEIGLFLCDPPNTVVQRTFQDSKGYVSCGVGKTITDPFFRILFGELVSPHHCLCQISYLMSVAKTDYSVYVGGETDAVCLIAERKEPVWIERLDMKMAEGFGEFFDEALASVARVVTSEIEWSDPKETVRILGIMSHIGLAFQRIKFRSRDRANPYDL